MQTGMPTLMWLYGAGSFVNRSTHALTRDLGTQKALVGFPTLPGGHLQDRQACGKGSAGHGRCGNRRARVLHGDTGTRQVREWTWPWYTAGVTRCIEASIKQVWDM